MSSVTADPNGTPLPLLFSAPSSRTRPSRWHTTVWLPPSAGRRPRAPRGAGRRVTRPSGSPAPAASGTASGHRLQPPPARQRLAATDPPRAYVARYPDDVDGWFLLGETQYHTRQLVGYDHATLRAPFDSVLARDSTLTPAAIHPVEVAMQMGDHSGYRPLPAGARIVGERDGESGPITARGEILFGRGNVDTATAAAMLRYGRSLAGVMGGLYSGDATSDTVMARYGRWQGVSQATPAAGQVAISRREGHHARRSGPFPGGASGRGFAHEGQPAAGLRGAADAPVARIRAAGLRSSGHGQLCTVPHGVILSGLYSSRCWHSTVATAPRGHGCSTACWRTRILTMPPQTLGGRARCEGLGPHHRRRYQPPGSR